MFPPNETFEDKITLLASLSLAQSRIAMRASEKSLPHLMRYNIATNFYIYAHNVHISVTEVSSIKELGRVKTAQRRGSTFNMEVEKASLKKTLSET